MDTSTELKKATKRMFDAAESVMIIDPPRNLDAAWKNVVMEFSSEFVAENYNELQSAFYAGLAANAGRN